MIAVAQLRYALAACAAACLGAGVAAAQPAPQPASGDAAAPAPERATAPPAQTRTAPPADAIGDKLEQAMAATSQGVNTVVTVDANGDRHLLIYNPPVPDTLENRAKYGQPLSKGGRRTRPAGN